MVVKERKSQPTIAMDSFLPEVFKLGWPFARNGSVDSYTELNKELEKFPVHNSMILEAKIVVHRNRLIFSLF